jgi:hypothetical protein
LKSAGRKTRLTMRDSRFGLLDSTLFFDQVCGV